MQIKNILKLRQKEAITGMEKIPVSKDEYVTVGQLKNNIEEEVSESLQDAAAAAQTAAAQAALVAASAQNIVDSYDSVVNVLSHSSCTLAERVGQLERLLLDVLSGKVLIPELQVQRLGVWGDDNLILAGPGAPAKAPDRAGQLYIDLTARALYYSTGNAAVSDWKNA